MVVLNPNSTFTPLRKKYLSFWKFEKLRQEKAWATFILIFREVGI
jgi:hypothetical protein